MDTTAGTEARPTILFMIYGWSPRAMRDCLVTGEALAKFLIDNNCHSERSEESRFFGRLRSFTSFRMTEKPVLQQGLTTKNLKWEILADSFRG